MRVRDRAAECVVIDTNVLSAAGGQRSDTSDACAAACISGISKIRDGRALVVVDEDGRIAAEYARRARELGDSGVAVSSQLHSAAAIETRRFAGASP